MPSVNPKYIIWPIIVLTLVIFLIWADDGSQNCLNQYCNNSAPTVAKNDTPVQSIDKIIDAVRTNHTLVGWRRAIIVALIVSLLVLILLYKRFPDGFTVFLIATFVFVGVYFIDIWFQAHWWKMNDMKIEESLYKLRSTLINHDFQSS